MKQRSQIILITLVLVISGVAFYLYNTGGLPLAVLAAPNSPTAVSGFIEGDQVGITSEVGGRIESIAVGEGDSVTMGQELVHLDHTLLDAQIAQGQAAVETAQAQLKQLTNGPRAADVIAARAARDAAQQGYDKLRAGPTASDLAAAQAALSAAEQNYAKVRTGPTGDQVAQFKAGVDNAKAALDQAQSAYDKIGGASNPYIGMALQSLALQQATNNYNAAVSAYRDARTHPTDAELAGARLQVQQAQAALDRLTPDAAQLAAAQSQLQQAQAALDRLTPTQDSIAVAQDQVKETLAALAVLQAQLTKMTLKSPVSGIVTNRTFQPGELATPGAGLLTITQLDPAKLTIFVPETQLGQIKLGDEIGVQVDTFPGRVFNGKVVFISPQAQFTPRNVQTKEQRVTTVFAVKLSIPNPDSALKPGMPADATLP